MAAGEDARARTTVTPRVAKSEGACDGACIICLDTDPRPMQSGCACRGDAGLAHANCRAEAAAHRFKHQREYNEWTGCGTCGQDFTGVMRMELAEEWWDRARRLPQEIRERVGAGDNLADALTGAGRFAEAETMIRHLLPVCRRVYGLEDRNTLNLIGCLAQALQKQGKLEDAEKTYKEVLAAQRRVLGHEQPDTLATVMNLASVLGALGSHAAAETMSRDLLTVQRRVLGPEHPFTLKTYSNVAGARLVQGHYDDAETIYREVLAVQRRVFGPEHPETERTAFLVEYVLHRKLGGE